MDYFTNNTAAATASSSSDVEQRIDYAAFCAFCKHRPQEVSVAVQRLQKMAFHRGSLDVFAKYDLQGRGSCSRVDLAESLREVRTSIHTQTLSIFAYITHIHTECTV
jgi:hypothetical protein